MSGSDKITSTINGSDLCLECGLCCQGVLFLNASFSLEETSFVQSLGLTISTLNQRLSFNLPCPLLNDKCCSIYAQKRPGVCGAYQCSLLKNYLAGALELPAALEIVARLQTLFQEVKQNLPEGISWAQIRGSETDFASTIYTNRIETNLLLAWARFSRYAQKHFQPNTS